MHVLLRPANTNRPVCYSAAGQTLVKMPTPKSGGSSPSPTQSRDLHQHRHEYLPRLGETSLPAAMRLLIMGTAPHSRFFTLKQTVALISNDLVVFPLPAWEEPA